MAVERPPSADALILDSAQLLGFTPEREALPADEGGEADAREADEAWRAYTEEGLEADFGRILRSRLLRCALQYIARKTGASELVIERFLTDVAYYLDVPQIRDAGARTSWSPTSGRRRASTTRSSSSRTAWASIVGYDLFDALDGAVDVPLFVTSGCPLGFPVVQRNLLPAWNRSGKRPGPELKGAPVPWLNAFDVRDFVALVHPLANFFSGALRDERTFNASDPHSIQDYLADPDVARPIGRVLRPGSRPGEGALRSG